MQETGILKQKGKTRGEDPEKGPWELKQYGGKLKRRECWRRGSLYSVASPRVTSKLCMHKDQTKAHSKD